MPLRNTLTRYGALAQFFHWTIVALIILQYVLAEKAEELRGLAKFKTLMTHKSVGITILTLAILRLLWRWTGTVPALPNTLKPYERALAHITHAALYILIFAIPISGWVMSNAQNFPVSYFGWFTLPELVQPNKEFGHLMEEVHEILFFTLVGVAILHVLAALKHHFWLKDNVLKRMLPFTSVAALSLTAAFDSAHAATPYTMDAPNSKLEFSVLQTDATVKGRFDEFKADIVFSPEDLKNSRFQVTVVTKSIDTGDDERDEALRDKDLFSVKQFPTATFVTSGFSNRGQNQYEAMGKLTIRNVTRDIRLPFTFVTKQGAQSKEASLTGGISIKRLDYGVGQGEWKDTDAVANEVKIKFSLRLLPGADMVKKIPAPSPRSSAK